MKSAGIAKQFFLTEYFTGIFYPSVKYENKEINLVMQPKLAIEFLKPIRVVVLEVLPKKGNLDRVKHLKMASKDINFTDKLS